METIKMSLEITLNFSKSAQTFIKSLITAQNGAPDKPEKAAPDKPENNVTIEDVRIEIGRAHV